MLIGNKTRLAFEIGGYCDGSKQLQHVKIWVADQLLTLDDAVYLPSFYTHMKKEILRLENGDLTFENSFKKSPIELFAEFEHDSTAHHQVLYYDVGTNPARCYFYEGDDGGILLCSHFDPERKSAMETEDVFVTLISQSDMLTILKESLENLPNVWV